MKNFKLLPIICLSLLGFCSVSCDSGGLPVSLVIDEYTVDVNLDKIMAGTLVDLQNLGLVGANTTTLPILWPDSLPDIEYHKVFTSEAIAVDLTPDPDSPEAEKYEAIGTVMKIIKRIDISRMVIRFETNSLTIPSPELAIQVADDKNALAEDRLAWRTIGRVPAKPAGWIGDMDFEFVPSGERYLKAQLMDQNKEFAIRIRSNLDLNLKSNDENLSVIPAGKITVRLILGGTFFVDTIEAVGSAEQLIKNDGNTEN